MSFPERTNTNWAKRQLYIALGFLLYACAQRQIDACPIEGFEPEKYNKILNLEAEGLEAVVICAIGYRSEEDKYAKAKKVRFPREMVIKQVTGS